jgi:CobQ-like glutamine amidotransferase family enzyme
MPSLRVCSLYPELMNIYADRGNIAILRARCEWRGLGFEHAAASLDEPLDPDAHDLFYIGGGQDRDQVAVACAAATSCSATPTGSAARSCRVWASSTCTRCASRDRG